MKTLGNNLEQNKNKLNEYLPSKMRIINPKIIKCFHGINIYIRRFILPFKKRMNIYLL